jgi:hypothetical protein
VNCWPRWATTGEGHNYPTSFQVFSAFFHREWGWAVPILVAVNVVRGYFSKRAIGIFVSVLF